MDSSTILMTECLFMEETGVLSSPLLLVFCLVTRDYTTLKLCISLFNHAPALMISPTRHKVNVMQTPQAEGFGQKVARFFWGGGGVKLVKPVTKEQHMQHVHLMME